jgi:osmotically inducible lipoprotein OsmB
LEKEHTMTSIHTLAIKGAALAAVISLSACAGMTHQDKSAVAGAGIGAVGGAVLTGGSALGTVGGAAVGGLIGNEVGKRK